MKITPFSVPLTPQDVVIDLAEKQRYFERIQSLLHQRDAVIIAHFYVAPEIQELAELSGGFVGDSLAMAQFGYEHSAKTLVVAGVKFMGESAKILSPEKTVLMLTLEATCSLDLGCPEDAFSAYCDEHSDRIVIVYANTSAAVKARADWVVTSSNALDIVRHLDAQGEKILWAPDRYLGDYIQKQTQADMILWQGACVVHEEFKTEAIKQLIAEHPEAAVLVHPESPAGVIALADVVGSTSRLIKASQELPHNTFIVATDRGIFYKMRQLSPEKEFIVAPTAGVGATCRSCGHCPWMAMNTLERLERALIAGDNEVRLDEAIIAKAQISLRRMLDFSR